jgi:AcrR family transcriptional regulator
VEVSVPDSEAPVARTDRPETATAAVAEADRPRREQRRADREAAIVRAAIEEFIAVGLANARLEDVAARAGVAKGTIYLYFDTKEDLYKAAVRSLIHPVVQQVEREVAEFQGPTEDLLRQALRTMYADITTRTDTRELMRLLIAEAHRMPEVVDFFYTEMASRGLATIRMIVWRGIALGEFRPSPAAEHPMLITAGCKALALWQLIFGDRHGLDVARYVDAHCDFVLAALRRDT